MKPKKKILLLEDDPNLGFILSEHLEMNGFGVQLCTNGVDGLAVYKKDAPALCLVDVMMPKKDGFTFVKEVRQSDQQTPIIFLTAKSLKEDRIEGLKIGADDYITKPFSMEELLLRINAVLKRSNGTDQSEQMQTEFSIGKFKFDSSKSILQIDEKKKRSLTAKESELLCVLALHSNSLVEREKILQSVWGNDSYYNARSMDVYISKLRKYLKPDPSVSIVNAHGKGYKLLVDR
ncbi:MAG: response regulator transcription factor [Ignavibacteriales bacterium]|nr:response regulator transcription factor [Ignavibacteriales bacterium]